MYRTVACVEIFACLGSEVMAILRDREIKGELTVFSRIIRVLIWLVLIAVVIKIYLVAQDEKRKIEAREEQRKIDSKAGEDGFKPMAEDK